MTVSVRIAPVEPAALARGALAVLSPLERARADRFRHVPSRDSYITAHVLVRMALSERTGSSPQDWEFRIEESGRPVVASPQEFRHLRFSLTHCTGLAACAIADGIEVGIDAETGERALAVDEIARYFSEQERSALLEAGLPERDEMFLRYWTLKESYAKARGSGLSNEALAGVIFTWDAAGIATPTFTSAFDERRSEWFFRTWSIERFVLACAVHAPPDTVRLDERAIDLSFL